MILCKPTKQYLVSSPLRVFNWRAVRVSASVRVKVELGNLPVHDTHSSFPLSRLTSQWRDAALAAHTQFFLHPRTGFCNKMPFPTRPLQPSSLGRGPLPPGEEPLQWVTNQNLCQAMRQLVSLLKQADSVFGDLEVRGEGCVMTVIGRVLFGDESNPCAQREAQTPGLKGRRTQLGRRDYS